MIKVGDGRELQVTGIGQVELQTDSAKIKISDVLFVPNMKINLLSIGKLTKKGLNLLFEKNSCKVMLNKELVANTVPWIENDNLYQLKVLNNKAEMALVSSETIDKWKLWHCRLGHLSVNNMKKIKAEDVEFNKDNKIEEFCKSCALGKQTKQPHKTIDKIDRDSDKVIVHSDLMGPIRTKSLGSNSSYVLTYLCSKTEHSFVYLLKNKSEQEEKFKEFKSYYELLSGNKIKELRTDNGREYLSNAFQSFLREAGIKHNTSVEYCPQSNGKAERLNRTLVEKARCMLITANLDDNLWGAAVIAANYLRNISPSSVLNNKSPYEALYGKLPQMSHLRIFGCKAYPLKLNGKSGKFEPVARKNCIMIGYGDKEGVYWILDKSTNKAFRSRDVKFDEKFDQIAEIEISDVEPKKNDENNADNRDETLNDSTLDENKWSQLEKKWKQRTPLKEPLVNNEINNEDDDETEEYASLESELGEETAETDKSMRAETTAEPNQRRVSSRVRLQTKFYKPGDANTTKPSTSAQSNYINFSYEEEEPKNLQEALKSKFSEKWKEAVNSEFQSLEENKTWSICKLPKGKKSIKTRWVFKIKLNSDNKPERFKARLVAKGYNQEHGIDYNETFAPVIKHQALKLFLAIAVNEEKEVHQIDISTAFLNGELEEEVFIEPPDGFKGQIENNQVLKLHKALYGLKQAPRAWNKKLVSTLREFGMKQCIADSCIFFKKDLFVAIYVDDIIITGTIESIREFKKFMSEKFKMKDLGKLNYILGIKVEYGTEGVMRLNQKHYISKMIEKFEMQSSKESDIPIQPNHNLTRDLNDEKEVLRELVDVQKYRKVIGSLIYLMTCTRPDISYAVGVLSRYMQEPRELHWRCLKRVLKYLKATQDYSLVYKNSKEKEIELSGFTDSDYAGSLEDRKSTSGFVFKYGKCVISWNSSKQKTISLSSTEAEYIGLATAAKEALWLKHILIELDRSPKKTIIYCDNQSTICLSLNPEMHARSKHIDIRHHFIREKIENQEFEVKYQASEEMVADILTKGLPRIKHYKCMELMGLKN
jgi:hypothetical protein